MSSPKILAFSGSLRRGSYNSRLVSVAAAGARAAGAAVTEIALRDFPMPLYDQDIEDADGIPEHGMRLKDLFRAHDGLLISSPEYNSSFSAALKNAIDWVSRPEADRPPLDCFDGKVAGLMAASPGALGGLRGLVHVRALLSNIRVLVLPGQVAVGKAHEAFAADGSLQDERLHASVTAIGATLASTCRRLASGGA